VQVLVLHLNRAVGLPDTWFALGDDVILTVLGQVPCPETGPQATPPLLRLARSDFYITSLVFTESSSFENRRSVDASRGQNAHLALIGGTLSAGGVHACAGARCEPLPAWGGGVAVCRAHEPQQPLGRRRRLPRRAAHQGVRPLAALLHVFCYLPLSCAI